jgi:hypothetical protein
MHMKQCCVCKTQKRALSLIIITAEAVQQHLEKCMLLGFGQNGVSHDAITIWSSCTLEPSLGFSTHEPEQGVHANVEPHWPPAGSVGPDAFSCQQATLWARMLVTCFWHQGWAGSAMALWCQPVHQPIDVGQLVLLVLHAGSLNNAAPMWDPAYNPFSQTLALKDQDNSDPKPSLCSIRCIKVDCLAVTTWNASATS